MSRQKRQKREIFDELIEEVRRSQNATDRFDSAVAEALGLNRTDMRCLDVLQREGPVTAGDRRRVLVELTPELQGRAGEFYGDHMAMSERLYQRYTLDQLELLLEFVGEGRRFNDRKAAELEQRNRGRASP